jgi:signal peptidase I
VDFKPPPAAPDWSPAPTPGFGVRLARFIGELLQTLVVAAIIFLGVNLVTARIRVEGSSMEPTLHDAELVVVNRLAYRWSDPTRGDSVVFRFPLEPERRFIKRIIGLPGEYVVIHDGQVTIDGVPLGDPYIAAPAPLQRRMGDPAGPGVRPGRQPQQLFRLADLGPAPPQPVDRPGGSGVLAAAGNGPDSPHQPARPGQRLRRRVLESEPGPEPRSLTADPVYSCPECQVGALRAANVSYIARIHGRLVTVPDFPGLLPSAVGTRYDEAALAGASDAGGSAPPPPPPAAPATVRRRPPVSPTA